MSDLDRWRERFPWVKWEEPAIVEGIGEGRLACRVCIAQIGLKAVDVDHRLFDRREQFDRHMEVHRT